MTATGSSQCGHLPPMSTPAAGSLAVRAPLLAEVALLALGAGVDGGVAARAADRQGSDRGGRGGVAGSPRSLSAGR